tara:strand:+ start:927 stop:1034 length:108 start_codon:yes stop_codon:yes gene_type:complete
MGNIIIIGSGLVVIKNIPKNVVARRNSTIMTKKNL